MAEEKAGKGILVKTIGTTVLGMVSGAVIMFVTPLMNTAIKPAKPLANFTPHQVAGLEVTFNNRSTNATQGWWDFGDGSALEPFAPDQGVVSHTYPRPGSYTVKLSLRNFLEDTNERAIPIQIEAADSQAPAIGDLLLTPLKSEPTAPATYRVTGSLKNAELGIWSVGDNRPLEIIQSPNGVQDRLVTFNDPGKYTLRLVAVNGKQTVEKSHDITVAKGNETHAHVALRVTFDAVQATREEKIHHRIVAFPPDKKEMTFAFKKEIPARPNHQILKATLTQTPTEPFVRNVKVEVSGDKSKALLTGELVRTSNAKDKNSVPPSWRAEVVIQQEWQAPVEKKKSDMIVVNLNLPTGSEKAITLLPLPALSNQWLVKHRHYTLEIHEARQTVWQDTNFPCTGQLMMRKKTWNVAAREVDGHMQLEIQAIPGRQILAD